MSVKVTGIADAIKAVQRVRDVSKPARMEPGMRKVFAPALKAARRRAPQGAIRSALRILGTSVDDRMASVWIGIRSKSKAFHSLFVEYGISLKRVRKSGGSTGRMPARPFLRPAVDESRAEVVAAFGQYVRDTLDGKTVTPDE